jgi:hypothetical protein
MDETPTSLKFNPKRRDFLSIGSSNKKVYIWKLESRFSESTSADLLILRDLARSNFDLD